MLFANITDSCLIWETMPAEDTARQQALQAGVSGISFFSDDVGVYMLACLTSDARLRWSDGDVWERRVLSNPFWKSKRRWPAARPARGPWNLGCRQRGPFGAR